MATIETFSWCPDPGGSVEDREKSISAEFGDGYVQSVGDGINTYRDVWNLTFSRDRATVKAIREFVRRHKQRMPFYWTPPDSDTKALYVATEPTVTYGGGDQTSLKVRFTRTYRARF